ncbi:LOB domain-containing protein 1-like [Cryptomeria japonica]|uniref:LOB domain-containing protein 1-like n=1 Tax=Cryptomeria japonica TaxID=3369 RepID=UPI0025ACAF1F|nr:LOB domain-containing protein 1-like [Cryptomeria japonica]
MPRIVYPCAACKIQRRKCGENCVLAPYFPPNDPHKFLVVHKFLGTSNIVKTLQDIPAEKRADAVESLVYEANSRVNDPIYGCVGAICRLQKQVLHLQSQLTAVQAELLNTQANLASLVTDFCKSSETGTAMDNELIVDQNSKEGLIVVQGDENPFGFWDPR